MGAAKVTSKGQITIPADIRNEWQIEPGDQLVFYTSADGRFMVRVRRTRVGAGRGVIPDDGSPIDRAIIGEAVVEGVTDRRKRSVPKRQSGSAR
jgi:antitoxin PrlF